MSGPRHAYKLLSGPEVLYINTFFGDDRTYHGCTCPDCENHQYLERRDTVDFRGIGLPLLTCRGCEGQWVHDPNNIFPGEYYESN